MTDSDFLFRGDIAALDPDVAELIRHETARQARYLILIPSESTIPAAVREALSSAFHNIYAEGYPLEATRKMSQAEILDYNARLPEYRRIADERYYKGTEYANMIEALARRRTAELFATENHSADKLFVNVQPLSGAPANNAVYSALLNVGDTVMGMDLIQGGHLTHGSPANRSGINYNIVSYGVDPVTEKLDYDDILALARQHKPKMIIAGFSSYPYQPDFHKFREIADEVGAYLMTDIAHVAGLTVAGAFPNPVGIADVVTFTTHKTFEGPRGAVIITHRADLAHKIDRAVFPGEQGGPHMNTIAALAVSLRLASTEQYKELQWQTVRNAERLARQLGEHGLSVPYGGTDTHLLLVDCKSIVGPDGTPLSGDMAARILDLAGIVLNRQTIPGDTSALRPSGIRIGTPWITQRGFGNKEIDRLAEIMATLLQASVPFSYSGRLRPQARAKIDFDVLQQARADVRNLAASVGIDTDTVADDYPHFSYYSPKEADTTTWHSLKIQGKHATAFLNTALTSDVQSLQAGEQQATWLLNADGSPISKGVLEAHPDGIYSLHLESHAKRAAAWLRSLSDSYVLFDSQDIYSKVPGPVDVVSLGETDTSTLTVTAEDDQTGYATKAYFIGVNGAAYAGPSLEALPEFSWAEPENAELLTTPLHSLHQELGAKMVPFAGYDMPVWYSSVTEEHLAVRKAAGIFDVSHMGVFDVRGAGAQQFLDTVTTNDLSTLAIGRSQYTFFLGTDGVPLDDLMIYRAGEKHYLLIVNASNNDKNWAWLNAIIKQQVAIDPQHPERRIEGIQRFELRDLRATSSGADQLVDLAIQGPQSLDILLELGGSEADKAAISKLTWAAFTRVKLGKYEIYVSRTGYTGERKAYELFVHPDQAAALFRALADLGAVPCGLAARDSLRTEAGLPLYGHELAGPLGLNPADAGFGMYVKLYKPFFIGKSAYIAHEQARKSEVARFRVDNRRARPPHQGDPIVDERGRVVGTVTSCSIDSEGYQLGQAYLRIGHNRPQTQLAVFAGSERARAGKPLNSLKIGDKVDLPENITVLSRFPKR